MKTNNDLLILKEKHHFIIKYSTLIIWFVLTALIAVFCAVPYFAFSPSDMGVAEGIISVILYVVFQVSKNSLEKKEKQDGENTITGK